jgi:hypothetical protein
LWIEGPGRKSMISTSGIPKYAYKYVFWILMYSHGCMIRFCLINLLRKLETCLGLRRLLLSFRSVEPLRIASWKGQNPLDFLRTFRISYFIIITLTWRVEVCIIMFDMEKLVMQGWNLPYLSLVK